MMWSIFLTAVGLFFVFEGILPFLSPPAWRQLMKNIFIQTDHALRVIGLISMLVGLVLVTIAHDLF